MPVQLNDAQKALFDAKNFAHVATINPDGTPQVNPVWIEYDGQHVVFNSEKKRLKVRNLERDPRVTVTVTDAANPYKYVEVRGRVVEIVPDEAAIDRLAKKYIGQDKYPWNKPGDVRVTVRIEPEKVSGMGL
jgi:PPOX class probable F420-dependent enzyme